jgi:hypothetical protein
MNVPSPNRFSKELLAAYADGELDADGRALVEQWLADHPEALDELRSQRELSASNSVLWEAAGPPEPTTLAWATLSGEIEVGLALTKPKGNRSSRLRVAGVLLSGLALSGTAAAILWLAFATTNQHPKSETREPAELVNNTELHTESAPAPHSPQAGDLATIAVLPIPTDDEVVLDRVPDLRGGWLPVGRHPVPGMLTLATVEEMYLEEIRPSPALSANGGQKMTTAPGDAPMIFAAKHR